MCFLKMCYMLCSQKKRYESCHWDSFVRLDAILNLKQMKTRDENNVTQCIKVHHFYNSTFRTVLWSFCLKVFGWIQKQFLLIQNDLLLIIMKVYRTQMTWISWFFLVALDFTVPFPFYILLYVVLIVVTITTTNPEPTSKPNLNSCYVMCQTRKVLLHQKSFEKETLNM